MCACRLVVAILHIIYVRNIWTLQLLLLSLLLRIPDVIDLDISDICSQRDLLAHFFPAAE